MSGKERAKSVRHASTTPLVPLPQRIRGGTLADFPRGLIGHNCLRAAPPKIRGLPPNANYCSGLRNRPFDPGVPVLGELAFAGLPGQNSTHGLWTEVAMPFDGRDYSTRIDALEKIDRVIDQLPSEDRWCKGALYTVD